MAKTCWFTNGNGDNIWSEDDNWSSSEGGASDTTKPVATDTVYFSDTSSSDNCDMDENVAFANLAVSSSDTGGTDDWTGDLDGVTYDVAVSGDFLFRDAAANLGLGTGTWTVAGDWDTSGVSTEAVEDSSTVVLTGTSKAFEVKDEQDFNDLTISGSYEIPNFMGPVIYGAFTLSGALVIGHYGITLAGGATSNFTGGTLSASGAGKLYVTGTASLSAAGTVSCDTQYTYNNNDTAVTARTYGGNLIFQAGNPGDHVLQAGTITVTGSMYLSAGGDNVDVTGVANNPTVNIGGDLDFTGVGGATENLLPGTGTWTVGGDCDLTAGTLTASTGTFNFNGVTQTLTSDSEVFYDFQLDNNTNVALADACNVTHDVDLNGANIASGELILSGTAAQGVTGGGGAFYNLTATNTSAMITWVDEFTVMGTYKCIVEGVDHTCTVGKYFAFGDLNLDGQNTDGITFVSSTPSSPYYWGLVAASPTDFSYVDVTDCDASAAYDFTGDADCHGAWEMEVDEDQLTDSSGDGNTGALTAADNPNYATGSPPKTYSAGYYEFAGDDEADAGGIAEVDGAAALTVVAWVQMKTLAEWKSVLSKHSSTSSRVSFTTGGGGTGGTDDVNCFVGNGGNTYGYTQGNFVAVDSWHHWVMRYDGGGTGNSGRLSFFFDNARKEMTYVGTIPATTPSNAASVFLGAQDATAGFITAWLDNIAVFDRALGAGEFGSIEILGLDGSGAVEVDASNGTNTDGTGNTNIDFGGAPAAQTMPILSSDGIHSAIFDGLVVRG